MKLQLVTAVFVANIDRLADKRWSIRITVGKNADLLHLPGVSAGILAATDNQRKILQL